MVPLLKSDNTIRVKELTCMVQINETEGFKFLFVFRKVQHNDSPLLIYDISTNLIDGYNQAFLQTYSLQKSKLDVKINEHNLNSEEIFKEIELFDESTREKLI